MTSEGGQRSTPGIGRWHFASLVLIVIAGAVLVWASFEVFADNRNTDRALAIIGAILPSVVAIAGAIFGAAAFKVGTASGATTGEAKAAVAESEREQIKTKSNAAIDLALAELGIAQTPAGQPQTAGTAMPSARERLIRLRDELNG